MATRRVIVELKLPDDASNALLKSASLRELALPLPGHPALRWHKLPPFGVPERAATRDREDNPLRFASYAAAAELDLDAKLVTADEESSSPILGVYSDPPILLCQNPSPRCMTDPDSVDDTRERVEDALHLATLQEVGCDGRGVSIAVVDVGFSFDFLANSFPEATFDRFSSFATPGAPEPGEALVGHGTMCGFDALIAAPASQLIDIAVVTAVDPTQPTSTTSFLSNVAAGYQHLIDSILNPPAGKPILPLVITNSWTVAASGAADFQDYNSDLKHPFNNVISALNDFGVDVVFAAGNCGPFCSMPGCLSFGRTIFGANSHPGALCVGAVDLQGNVLGYSSRGPGFLADQKPDLCSYSHFIGSGVNPFDRGTSAAAPLAAGVIAALRAKFPFNMDDPAVASLSPTGLRQVLDQTATRQANGFDVALGFGILAPAAALAILSA